MRRLLLHLVSLLATVVATTACTKVAGLDDLVFTGAGGGGTGAGGSSPGGAGGSAGSGGAGGSDAPCATLNASALTPVGGVGFEYAFGGTVAPDGDFLLTGDFAGDLHVGSTTINADGQDGFLLERTAGGAWGFQRFAGGPDNQHGIAVSAVGNDVVWAGYFGTTLNIGNASVPAAGSFDIHLAKLTTGGVPVWVKTYGDGASQRGSPRVALAPSGDIALFGTFQAGTVDFGGGVMVTSSGSYEVYLAKLDPSGTGIWARSFGAVGEDTRRQANVSVDAAGDIYIAGRTVDAIDLKECGMHTADGSVEGYAAKFSSSGVCVWATYFPAGVESQVMDAKLDADGNLMVVGDFAGVLDLGGQTLTSQGRDGFFAELDGASGSVSSLRVLGGPLDDDATTIHPHGDGAVVAGHFSGLAQLAGCELMAQGAADPFIVQLDAAGNGVAAHQLVGDAKVDTVLSNGTQLLMFGHFTTTLTLEAQAVVATDSAAEGFIATFLP